MAPPLSARILARCLALGAAALLAGPAGAQETGLTAFVGVHVVPMDRDTVLADRTVVVADGRVRAVLPAADARVPAGARRIDGRGRWLMPALADMHVHFVPDDDATNERLLRLYLARGVTSVLSLMGDPTHVALRERLLANDAEGPVLYTSGPILQDTAMDRAAGRAAVDEHRRLGYDVVKVYNALPLAAYRGITERAAELGIPVVGHVVRAVGLEGTLGARQHGLVHAEEYLYTYFGYRNSDTTQVPERLLDERAIPHLARLTAAAGTWVTPTLTTQRLILAQARDVEATLARPEVRYVPRAARDMAGWDAEDNGYARRFGHPAHHANLAAAIAYQRALVRALHEAGVPLLAGTDALVAGLVPGFSMHDELRELVDAGLAPYDALVAATRNPAAYLGRPGEFGVVTPGARADLLLLEANPLDDVGNAGRIAGVMARGRWYDAAELAAMLERLADAP